MKLLFSNKGNHISRLIMKNDISRLKLNENLFVIDNKHKNIRDPVEKIIAKYQFLHSIFIIKNNVKNTNTIRFKCVILSDIKNEINGLNPIQATTHNYIPQKILQQSAKVAANTLKLLFNNAISNSEFFENSKLSDVTPVFKKKRPLRQYKLQTCRCFTSGFKKFLKC